jgi:allantoinase
MSKYALYSQRVLIEDHLSEATVFISDGQIVEISIGLDTKDEFEFRDYKNQVIMPGLIDCHVHINEPGRTNWEGFDTATMAASAGGVTSLVDMPLNSSPVTTNLASFKDKVAASSGKLHVNCGFWGGYIGQDLNDLEEMLQNGILGVKVFLTHSGIDEFPSVTETDLRKAMPVLKKHDALILAHCELVQPGNTLEALKRNLQSYKAYLASRPREWENEAIALMIRLCREFRVRTHIVHVSSSDALSLIEKAKDEGAPLTAETCPHYLYFQAENILDGATLFKCAPPIRENENNELLWSALGAGSLDFVVTDHSPSPPAMKRLNEGDFLNAWGGISSLQFSLSAVWTKARLKGYEIIDVANWMSLNIADFLKIKTKGQLRIGYDADIVIWNPEESYIVEKELILHRHKETPYLGEQLYGVVSATLVNGSFVFENKMLSSLNRGKTILNN